MYKTQCIYNVNCVDMHKHSSDCFAKSLYHDSSKSKSGYSKCILASTGSYTAIIQTVEDIHTQIGGQHQ